MNKEDIINHINNNGISTINLSRQLGEFANDREVILVAVRKNASIYSELPDTLRSDPEILRVAIESVSTFSINPMRYALSGAMTKENILLGISKRLLSDRTMTPEMLADKDIVIHFMQNINIDIYEDLSDGFRRDPEILRVAIENSVNVWHNPLKYALPEAMTKENIFLAIDRDVLSSTKLTSEMLADKDIVMYFIQNKNASIYEKISQELKRDPEVLKVSLEKTFNSWDSPLKYALPEAITKENILLAIDRDILTASGLTPEMLADRDIVKHFIRNKNNLIYSKLSEELRKDPEILRITLEKTSNSWDSPLKYALPEAITKDNIFLAIDRDVLTASGLTPEMLADRDIVKHFIQNKNNLIYKKISDELRKDPEILRITLEKTSNSWDSPLEYALPEAITKDNIFLAIDRDVLTSSGLTPEMLADRDIVMYFIQNKNNRIYSKLSEELRKDPEILRIAIESSKDTIDNPIRYALPEAITNDIIDILISNNMYPEEDNLLNNKYYVLRAIEKKPQILRNVSDELKKDPEIQRLTLVFNPNFISTLGADSLTEYMISYAKEYGLEINEDNIIDIILSDDMFIKRVLKMSPKVYTLLSEEKKRDIENIQTILSVNGKNLIYVPSEYITDDYIELSIKNGGCLYNKHFELFYDFFNRKINEDSSSLFDLFINTTDLGMQLVLLQSISISNIQKNPEVEEKMNLILNKYKEKYKRMGIEEKYISNFIQKVLNGETCALNLESVMSFEDLMYATNFGNLFPDEKSRKNAPMRLRPMLFNTVSFDVFTKANTRQYKEIKQFLLDIGLDDFTASKIGLKGYSAIGFPRMQELLNGKYGPIDINKLEHLFGDLDCSEVIFEPDGKKFKPMLNEQLINLLFGTNYKVVNTPIRNFLNGFSEMESYINKKIEKISANGDLSDEEKKQRIEELNSSFKKYCSSVRDFVSNINFIFNNWDVIEEEFLKKQSVSKLKIKLNITQVNEIVDSIKNVRKTITTKKGFSNKQQNRYKRIPGYEPRDYPLVQSDVFDYVGIQTQYTTNPEQAPARAVQLSRMMENKSTKKIPNVNLDYGTYSIKIFNPQDRNLISAGYRSGCCFRPNGNADNSGRNNSLLTYCCATEYGSGIEIKDSNGKTLMFSPVLRNGNVLMIHSFETIGLTEHEKDVANALLYAWAEEVIKVSQQEERENGIIAVAMTDLHSELDTSKSKAVLSGDKQFKVYNPNHSFDGMYNNLAGNNHHVLAFAPNKNIKDIMYDREVEKSYQYPNQIWDVKTVAVSSEQLEMIQQIRTNKEQITILANKRRDFVKARQQEQAFEILKGISEIRKANLSLQRNLYAMSPNAKKDILTDYIDGVEMANQVCDELKTTRKAEVLKFSQIFYSEGWYLGITLDEKLYGDCIRGFEPQFMSALTDIRKNYGLELEYDFGNDNNKIIPKGGGLKA